MKHTHCIFILLLLGVFQANYGEKKENFNSHWFFSLGEEISADSIPQKAQIKYSHKNWEKVTLPHAFNQNEAFARAIDQLSDTIVWYRKHFTLEQADNKLYFLEFEGFRQAAEVYVNENKCLVSQDGVMACGVDITPFIHRGENLVAVRIDNDWKYREKETGCRFQWNDKNFNANYGGITKNVYLHTANQIYQTLPLLNNLQTTGTYIYASDIRIKEKSANLNVETQVCNSSDKDRNLYCRVEIKDLNGEKIAEFNSAATTVGKNQKAILKASAPVSGLNFWSWGYGYLYNVETTICEKAKEWDKRSIRTGFRKTEFNEGRIKLNDRVIQLKGYAQRSSNEWPAVGVCLPAWMSDYSNALMVESNANVVRWMHITPSKQDIESCDRVGLMQAMPAGDAEKDAQGRQWQQRLELMKQAMVYNRNNPSIIFYECGNKGISEEHIKQMIELRNEFDPYGGRAVGSREMLESSTSEYGGEMLYINKSRQKPLWAMEYSRDEGFRKYWDNYSYPFHKDGDGPLYKGKNASQYNRNQDSHAIENLIRWYDYWRERPGTGSRQSSGGVNIIFSDTNTHFRGAENYRCSGEVDAMRIPKDGFYTHQVMWDGWVDIERHHTHIIGHWNYPQGTSKPVYVVSSADSVQLELNGRGCGKAIRSYDFLFTFENIRFEKGVLLARSFDKKGTLVSSDTLITAEEPSKIKLNKITSELSLRADAADMAIIEVEVTDSNGQRCPLADNMIRFSYNGELQWLGGIAQGANNCILSDSLPTICGINRVLIRTTDKAGKIFIKAESEGLESDSLTLESSPTDCQFIESEHLRCRLERGATPENSSFSITKKEIAIDNATAGCNEQDVALSWDDNEKTNWHNDKNQASAWIRYHLKEKTCVDEICMKLGNWRSRSYNLEVLADNETVFRGKTQLSLGYVHIPLKKNCSNNFTIRLIGAENNDSQFSQITELEKSQEYKTTRKKNDLTIIEIEFLKHIDNSTESSKGE